MIFSRSPLPPPPSTLSSSVNFVSSHPSIWQSTVRPACLSQMSPIPLKRPSETPILPLISPAKPTDASSLTPFPATQTSSPALPFSCYLLSFDIDPHSAPATPLFLTLSLKPREGEGEQRLESLARPLNSGAEVEWYTPHVPKFVASTCPVRRHEEVTIVEDSK